MVVVEKSESGGVLCRRALNRALLARQLLPRKAKLPALEAIERLAGMQSQLPSSPYTGLWSRLREFRHQELSDLNEQCQVVRIALMRSTIHPVSVQDCLMLRPVVQPVISRGTNTTYGKMLNGVDLEELSSKARQIVEEAPRTSQELGDLLLLDWPESDAHVLSQAARSLAVGPNSAARCLGKTRSSDAHDRRNLDRGPARTESRCGFDRPAISRRVRSSIGSRYPNMVGTDATERGR